MFPFFSPTPLQTSDYSDVGKSVSSFQRDQWSLLRTEYDKADRYYRGSVFQDRVEVETGEGDALKAAGGADREVRGDGGRWGPAKGLGRLRAELRVGASGRRRIGRRAHDGSSLENASRSLRRARWRSWRT